MSRILDNILKDSKSPIHQIIDEEFVKNLVQTGGATFNKPWFGQLMTGSQVIVYLIQVNTWMELYNVDFQIKNKSHAVLFICMGFIFYYSISIFSMAFLSIIFIMSLV